MNTNTQKHICARAHTRLLCYCVCCPCIIFSRGKAETQGQGGNVSARRSVQNRLTNNTLLSDGKCGEQHTCRENLLNCIYVDENSTNRASFPLPDACMDNFICWSLSNQKNSCLWWIENACNKSHRTISPRMCLQSEHTEMRADDKNAEWCADLKACQELNSFAIHFLVACSRRWDRV